MIGQAVNGQIIIRLFVPYYDTGPLAQKFFIQFEMGAG